jgi:ketosteroid isomerase-like protein
VNQPLEVVQDVYAAFARGDLPAVLAHFDPAIEWRTPDTLPWSRGTYHGHAGAMEYFTSFLDALDEPHIVPRELVVAGDRVICLGVERARARSTGLSFEAEFAHVFWLLITPSRA